MLITHVLTWEPGKSTPPALKIHALVDDGTFCGICGQLYGDHAEWLDLTLCPGDKLVLGLIRRNERVTQDA